MTNPFLTAFHNTVVDRYNIDTKDMTLGDWICANTSLNKRKFSFDRYPFQKQIADDMHENLDCIKPSQVGLTEIQIRKALALLKRNDNLSLIYTMPNENMFKRISKARIQPLIEYDKAFQTKGSNNRQSMDLMKIGSSYMYVTGSSEADATSINADIVFNDEIDLTPQAMLGLFNSRLQGSDWRINQRFSTPTYAGFGVDKGYSSSDQHEYFIKCRACNHQQVPLFNRDFVHIDGLPDNLENLIDIDEKLVDEQVIDLQSAHVICQKCHKPLDLSDYKNRQWVSKFPSRVHSRGYRVRPFSTHRLDPMYIIGQLLIYKRRDNLKGFCNTVLGETYEDSDTKLTDAQIDLVLRDSNVQGKVDSLQHWIGIDVGLTCHIVVGAGNSLDKVHILRILTCREDELRGVLIHLASEYEITGGGMDRFPYTPLANDVRDDSKGKIMPVEYRGSKDINEVKDTLGVISHLQANRTMMLDHVASGIRKATWTINGYGLEGSVIKEHLKDMVREVPAEGEARWVKLNNNDHYFHAFAFMVSAMVYNGIMEEKKGFEPLSYGIFGTHNGMLGKQTDVFGASDLIGFSARSGKSDKIITRY
jgi:hypothetical protein